MTEESQKQLALTFVEKVAGINLSRFAHSVLVIRPEPDYIVQVYVSSEQGNATIKVYLMRGKVCWFYYKPETPPSWLWTETTNDRLVAARQIVERSQLYLNASPTQCLDLLSGAVSDQNQTIARGNMTLQIKDNGRRFDWEYKLSGVTVLIYLQVQLSEDGHLISFGNGGQVYSVGTTQVNISKERAIDIALALAQSYANEHWQGITAVNAWLLTTWDWSAHRGDKYVKYLDWRVQVSFDRMNSNGMTRYIVQLAADTGQVLVNMPDGPVKEFNSQGAGNSLNTIFAFVAVVIVASTTTASVVVYRRRRANKIKRE